MKTFLWDGLAWLGVLTLVGLGVAGVLWLDDVLIRRRIRREQERRR
jgi:hypothetical protein